MVVISTSGVRYGSILSYWPVLIAIEDVVQHRAQLFVNRVIGFLGGLRGRDEECQRDQQEVDNFQGVPQRMAWIEFPQRGAFHPCRRGERPDSRRNPRR